mgnify:FL=1
MFGKQRQQSNDVASMRQHPTFIIPLAASRIITHTSQGRARELVGGWLVGWLVQMEDWEVFCTLDRLRSSGRVTGEVRGRMVVVFHARGVLSCLDARCYHTGGPLNQGDIEVRHQYSLMPRIRGAAVALVHQCPVAGSRGSRVGGHLPVAQVHRRARVGSLVLLRSAAAAQGQGRTTARTRCQGISRSISPLMIRREDLISR